MRKNIIALILTCTLMTGFSATTATAQEVMALAAGIAPCVEEIMDLYESEGNSPLSIVKGPCGTLARQTEAGAPFGLVMMAEPRWPQWMADKKLLKEIATFAIGQVVLWSPNNTTPDLRQLSSHMTAIPEPKTTAYGMAAKNFLESQKLWDDFLKGDFMMVNSAPQAILAAQKGATQWAFVPITAAIKAKGAYLVLPGATLPQVGGLTEKAGPDSRSFWTFCRSKKADPIWEKWGFLLEKRI